VSRRLEVEHRLRGLGEIRDIMNAMKNLAVMETHKLTRVLAAQQRVVASIRSAAADFISFYPDLLPRDRDAREVYVLLGSERGFCGDFNDALVRKAAAQDGFLAATGLIAIGSRLGEQLAGDSRAVARISGPSVLDEVESVLLRFMETLQAWQASQTSGRPLRLTVVHHRAESAEITVSRLRPFSEPETPPPRSGHPPLLNLEPSVFLAALAEQYLFAALHEIFYGSLMAENQRRVQHMSEAVKRLDDQSSGLLRTRNVLRQEEITEEIEIIMLNVGTPW